MSVPGNHGSGLIRHVYKHLLSSYGKVNCLLRITRNTNQGAMVWSYRILLGNPGNRSREGNNLYFFSQRLINSKSLMLNHLHFIIWGHKLILFCFETKIHVAQAGSKHHSELALDSRPSCLYLQGARKTGVGHLT